MVPPLFGMEVICLSSVEDRCVVVVYHLLDVRTEGVHRQAVGRTGGEGVL